jgi:hypothetical protein
VVLWVDRLQVADIDVPAEDLLVEGSAKVGVKETAVVDGFTDDSADELEVGEVFAVDRRGLVGLVGLYVGSTRLKEGCGLAGSAVVRARLTKVGIKDLSREHRVPFPRHTTRIHSVLMVKLDVEFPILDLIPCPPLQRVETVFKDILSPDVEVQCTSSMVVLLPLELLEEPIPLVVKFEDSRVADEKRE